MKRLKHVSLLLVLGLLSGCASKPVVIATSQPLCKAVKHECISKDDELTEGTATQIEGNNLARERLCGKPPKCKKKI